MEPSFHALVPVAGKPPGVSEGHRISFSQGRPGLVALSALWPHLPTGWVTMLWHRSPQLWPQI